MNSFAEHVIEVFSQHSDEANAKKMAAYMKNKFSFYGIKSPLRNEISKPFMKIKIRDTADLREIVQDLWDQPHRELHYLAMELLHRHRRLLSPADLDFLQQLITTNSWWDTVDNLASKVVGLLLLKFPDEMKAWSRKWIKSDNLWLNRTAIIFQLKYKEEVDTELLTEAIEAHAHSKEFFHGKAIGWALRQYSKVRPGWVTQFIGSQELQPLSVREGRKYMS